MTTTTVYTTIEQSITHDFHIGNPAPCVKIWRIDTTDIRQNKFTTTGKRIIVLDNRLLIPMPNN